MEVAGERMAGRGVLMAGIAPNPLPDAGRLIETMSGLEYPPDVYLVMPLTGIVQPAGLYGTYMEFAERAGECGARLLYYLRSPDQIPYVARLVNDSPHFIGVKVGTRDEDVAPLVERIDRRNGMVIWGIGDRSTRAAELGATGHTSGINIAFSLASDEINNAQRCGDYEVSLRMEGELAALEEIRFRDGRMYNYSAVVEAMHAGGWEDVVAGEGGPFNPRVPPEVAAEVRGGHRRNPVLPLGDRQVRPPSRSRYSAHSTGTRSRLAALHSGQQGTTLLLVEKPPRTTGTT